LEKSVVKASQTTSVQSAPKATSRLAQAVKFGTLQSSKQETRRTTTVIDANYTRHPAALLRDKAQLIPAVIVSGMVTTAFGGSALVTMLNSEIPSLKVAAGTIAGIATLAITLRAYFKISKQLRIAEEKRVRTRQNEARRAGTN
jgi:hypothetical protein